MTDKSISLTPTFRRRLGFSRWMDRLWCSLGWHDWIGFDSYLGPRDISIVSVRFCRCGARHVCDQAELDEVNRKILARNRQRKEGGPYR